MSSKLELFLEVFGAFCILCGLIARVLPEGSKAAAVFERLGSLPWAAAKAAMAPKSEAPKQ